jgi:uncharacterized protein (TIGR02271 family)
MTVQDNDYSGWIGHELVDPAGDKIGKVSQIYVDDRTGQPTWVAVSTGLFGKKSSFVPLLGTTADGDRLVSGWDKDKVKGAPQIDDDAGDGHMTPAEEQDLYSYYGLGYETETTAPTAAAAGTVTDRGAAGHDTSGPNTDDAMTRSEEQIRVGTATQESGRARLRKYVVTEQVTQTVPVSHEEVRVEREAITDANRDAAMGGAEISEEEHEVILHEERPVVQKDVVPVERVRLATETVTGEATIDEQVRKEVIEEEGVEVDPETR